MQNKYSIWKYCLIFTVCVIGILYSIPNIYIDDPAIQLSASGYDKSISQQLIAKIKSDFTKNKLDFKSFNIKNNDVFIRFSDTDS